MMLCIAPQTVDMSKAIKDYDAKGQGALTRTEGHGGCYSRSGIFGDPTLATREKGEKVCEFLVARLLDDIAALRTRALPK
jgi:creatinine amidohydrolase